MFISINIYVALCIIYVKMILMSPTPVHYYVNHFSPLSLSWVQVSCSVVSDYLWPHELQHSRPPCPSPTRGVYSDSCPLSQWCHPTILSPVIPFSSRLQSFPASGSFPVVRYGCENWTIKKAECRRLMLLNCGVGEDSWESLGLHGDPRSPS